MLPVVAGKARTRRDILAYSVAMALAGLAPGIFGPGGVAYLGVAAAGGAIFVALAWSLYRAKEGIAGDRCARKLFAFSIFYLFGLFAMLIVEHALGWV
jgi:protoheme IX farnesyltransferase